MGRLKGKVALFAISLALFAIAMSTPAQLPPSKGAPQVGEKAPDFTLPDTSTKPVMLSELLADPAAAAKRPVKNAPALLLIFYRGYW